MNYFVRRQSGLVALAVLGFVMATSVATELSETPPTIEPTAWRPAGDASSPHWTASSDQVELRATSRDAGLDLFFGSRAPLQLRFSDQPTIGVDGAQLRLSGQKPNTTVDTFSWNAGGLAWERTLQFPAPGAGFRVGGATLETLELTEDGLLARDADGAPIARLTDFSVTDGTGRLMAFQLYVDPVSLSRNDSIRWFLVHATYKGQIYPVSFQGIWEPAVEAPEPAGSCDVDGDGQAGPQCDGPDCNDSNPNIFSGAQEVPANGIDENCDGGDVCYQDADSDGFGTSTLINSADLDCNDFGESPTNGNDCNDNNASIYPGATEIPGNQVDEDCNGGELCYADNDSDGFATNTIISSADLDCNDFGESPTNGNDCNDNNASIYPGATEIPGNQVDEDCNGGELCYADNDSDGFATNTIISSADLDCNDFGESPTNGNDCNDNNASIYPGATEIPGNQVDEDCNGGELCYADNDSDGFATNTIISSADLDCNDFGESPTNGNDCNDNNASIYPGATEIPGNQVDEDCNGGELCYADNDSDGFATNTIISSADLDCNDFGESPTNGNDCNDNNASIYPGATEIPGNQVDEDCNGGELCYADNDSDGFATNTIISSADLDCNDFGESPTNGNDCNDNNASIYPGATEIPGNQVDEDCNGGELCYADNDSDGFATNTVISSADLDCSDFGESPTNGNDCNDGNPAVYPGAAEQCNNADDNCNNLVDEGFAAPTTTPSLVLDAQPAGTEISWGTTAATTGYDIVQGDLALLLATSGDFATSSQSCFANDVAAGPLIDSNSPLPNQGYWYLARAQNCAAAGSWDSGGVSQIGSRDTGIQASGTCP